MNTAHNEATTPISATELLPSSGFSKSNKVRLKMVKPTARKINIVVKTFMVIN